MMGSDRLRRRIEIDVVELVGECSGSMRRGEVMRREGSNSRHGRGARGGGEVRMLLRQMVL
jgi:hypothetical protein